jgi:DNA polymerase-1
MPTKRPKRVDTGRIVSMKPALQDIPIRTEEGRRIRDAFTEKRVLVGCDYAGLEMRMMTVILTKKS